MFLFLNTDVNVYLHKGNKQTSFFVGILKATEENSRIRIRTNMSRIHNTVKIRRYQVNKIHSWFINKIDKGTRSRDRIQIFDKNEYRSSINIEFL